MLSSETQTNGDVVVSEVIPGATVTAKVNNVHHVDTVQKKLSEEAIEEQRGSSELEEAKDIPTEDVRIEEGMVELEHKASEGCSSYETRPKKNILLSHNRTGT